jgi:hypothetical protein
MITTSRDCAITFHPTDYAVIPIQSPSAVDYFAVPTSGTFLDLISVIQIRRGALKLPLGDVRLLDEGSAPIDQKRLISHWATGQKPLALRMLKCEQACGWDPNDQVEVRIEIADREDLFVFPAMATLAYVRSRIGAKYHVLWDNIWFAPSADLSQRLSDNPNLGQIVFPVFCGTHKVMFSSAGNGPIPVNMPVLSQVCDMHQEWARRTQTRPFDWILSTAQGPLSDEERLNDIARKGGLDIRVEKANRAVNRLYFRVDGMKVIKDVPLNQTFGQLAWTFGDDSVAFELDRGLLPRSTRVDQFMGHPRHPIYVVKRPLFLPIVSAAGDFYVAMDKGMTVRGLRAVLPEFADAATHRFDYDNRVLRDDDVIIAVNPDLLPVTVKDIS